MDDDERVEWPEPLPDPKEEPTEPWARYIHGRLDEQPEREWPWRERPTWR